MTVTASEEPDFRFRMGRVINTLIDFETKNLHYICFVIKRFGICFKVYLEKANDLRFGIVI